MIGKLKQLKWTEKPETSRDLVFLILILAFGIVLVAKLAPYFGEQTHSVVYSSVQTAPTTPKNILDQLMGPPSKKDTARNYSGSGGGRNGANGNRQARSIVERPLFDGQAILLNVRSISSFTSKDSTQPIEVSVINPLIRGSETEIDFTPSEGAKLIGKGEANISTKRLYINFSQLITRDGRSYVIQGQAVDPENLTAGVQGEYSSGLPARLLGIAIDRAINVGDEIGMAHIFSATGPDGPAGQDFKKAAMETNQQASQNIAGETSKDLRETPAEISLQPNTEFFVRIQATQSGASQ